MKQEKAHPLKKRMAQIYGETLENIGARNKGRITPESVVKEAKQKTSALNSYFQWDDNKAAEQYRLHQARSLINHIVEVVIIEGKQSLQRSFFSVRNGGGNIAYVSLKKAIATPSYKMQLLNQLISTMENATELMKMFRSNEK